MRKRKYLPLLALGTAAGVFAVGVVASANAQDSTIENPVPKWAQEQLLQQDAIALWNSEIENRLKLVPEGVLVPNGSPAILNADYSSEGDEHKVYYERGLVENLLDRYVRCASIEAARASGDEALTRAAETSRESFSQARGVMGIMNIDDYFADIESGAAAEGMTPANYELTYMCDVLETEGK